MDGGVITEIDDNIIGKIIRLRIEGNSIDDITRQCDVSSDIVKKYLQESNVTDDDSDIPCVDWFAKVHLGVQQGYIKTAQDIDPYSIMNADLTNKVITMTQNGFNFEQILQQLNIPATKLHFDLWGKLK